MNHGRILGFDFLRGLCAMGVAVYHVLGWQEVDRSHLYSVGLYGVYIFFVLSGASIYTAYAAKIRAGYDLRRFIGLRVFRLLPLFALVVLAGPLIDYGNFQGYGAAFWQKTILNLTFAFGFGNPGQVSLATGGWSLGIEFVFYLLFPVILAFVSGGWRSSLLFLAFVIFCQMLYIRFQLPAGASLASNWVAYTQFLSFAGYFVAGCLVGRLLQATRFDASPAKWQAALWGAFALSAAAIIAAHGDFPTAPLIATRGLLLPLVCIALVYVAGHLRFSPRMAPIAAALGTLSYGLYLLHPLIYTLVKKHFAAYPSLPLLVVVTVVALAGAYALLFEKLIGRPALNFGKRLLSAKPAPAMPLCGPATV